MLMIQNSLQGKASVLGGLTIVKKKQTASRVFWTPFSYLLRFAEVSCNRLYYNYLNKETGATGFEPATFGSTGRFSNQLRYAPH